MERVCFFCFIYHVILYQNLLPNMISQLCTVSLAIHEYYQIVAHCHLLSPGSLYMELGMALQA